MRTSGSTSYLASCDDGVDGSSPDRITMCHAGAVIDQQRKREQSTWKLQRWSCFLNHSGGKIRWIAGWFIPPVSCHRKPFHWPRSGSTRRCRNAVSPGCSSQSRCRCRAGLRSRSRTRAGRRTRISGSATAARRSDCRFSISISISSDRNCRSPGHGVFRRGPRRR